MKIIRWKYILPRLGILLVLGLVLRFGLDPALRWALIRGGESVLGAQVELSQVHSSLWSGQLSVKDLALTNPRAPLRNLLEATDSQLQLDVHALLQGRLVVSDGKLSNIRCDTDRETSGALVAGTPAESGPSALEPLLAAARSRGAQWFEQLGERLSADIADQLESPRLAQELQASWPRQYTQLEQQIKDIHRQGQKLKQDFRDIQSKPLESLERLPSWQQEVAQLQQKIKSVQQQLGELPARVDSDQRAVLSALQQDEALIRERLHIDQLDGEGLGQTLLGQPVSAGLTTALEWIRWTRAQLPPGLEKSKQSRKRGTTVLYTLPQPTFVIQRLQLDGFAQLSDEPLPLVGTLTGASSAPQLLDEPTRIELHSNEALGMTVQVELDRRGKVPHDLLQITCPHLSRPAMTLGNTEPLAIRISPGTVRLQVDLALRGEQLSGKISYAQESLTLTSQLAQSSPGALRQALNQALAGIRELEVTVSLAGTLDKPQLRIDSGIGSQIATACNAAVARWATQHTEELVAHNRQQVDAQLQQLTKMQQQAEQELLAQLGTGQELLGQLATFSGGTRQRLPAGIPKFGRKFGLDSF